MTLRHGILSSHKACPVVDASTFLTCYWMCGNDPMVPDTLEAVPCDR